MTSEMTDNEYDYEFIIESDSDDEFIIESDSDDSQLSTMENYYGFTEEDYEDSVILCVDIGVINLGLAALTYDSKNFKFKNVVGVELIDITEFHHPCGVCSENCGLQHTKTFTDWMEHIFLTYSNAFENCDKIIIERQPPGGFNAIEQLIFSRYRDKTELVSPRSMHKFLDIGMFNYDRRKECVVKFAKNLIKNHKIIEDLEMYERKHDMADAICLGYYWLNFQRSCQREEEMKIKALEIQMAYLNNPKDCNNYLQQFIYIGNCRRNYMRL